ncbi:helix-turn-helix domain containing protein [Pigmentibacter sp. JX0631]|uniref:TetR/AcrR family transcriptional regulator n=1 Tax=Pigmentibacter sp. JX0631 TaxID=2976982 RepID=UPI0024693949|nr:helix-turn-helix domain-containing protein [Pigmentibacter sp. JX0631]WGL61292.1 helix-turn-helix domain containing protein [Pigmentibacter sp. JX0631]
MKKTKLKIIEAATNLFIQKGFSGASISEIAKEAGINQSLIYHHVGNKLELWKTVKKHLLNVNLSNSVKENLKSNTLIELINSIVISRINFYNSDPRIKRLMQWQQLEDSQDVFKIESNMSPHLWIKKINKLQNIGEISNKYTAEFYGFIIYSLVNSLIFDSYNVIKKDLKKNSDYVENIIEVIVDILRSK